MEGLWSNLCQFKGPLCDKKNKTQLPYPACGTRVQALSLLNM